MSVIGMLAHVDAGKTTLSESLLFKSGKINNPGRVDHKDAYLDTNRLEKNRGITIFAKQATFDYKGRRFYMQDTPGHVDFSSEMERTLSVLDYAVLVISAPDGIQSHTSTLLELLERYDIPTLIFVNKTDLTDKKPKLPSNCIDFKNFDYEDIALLHEDALKEYEETGMVSDTTIQGLINNRRLIPVFYGSALKLEGIDEFLDGLFMYTIEKQYDTELKARCFKITRDEQGNRLTWLKILGGSVSVREMLGEEKVTGIREYSGIKYSALDRAISGSICAVTGLENSYAGQGFGLDDLYGIVLEPVLTYTLNILDGTDTSIALRKFSQLQEEDPLLRICWNEKKREIEIQLMGQIQTEVITQIIEDRFGIKVSMEEGKIVYKETIKNPVEGIGHFEPLRHYAEVHLLMEPLETGSGLVLETACPIEVLDKNWQGQILYSLAEKKHVGVLTGSPITDMKITLIAGRSHIKHTEGGDFRQASLRAVRQGLMKAENVLLEPYYSFSMEIPKDQIGRAINDVKAMGGDFNDPEDSEISIKLTGMAPVCEMQNYQTSLLSYTKGKGKLSLRFKGFYPCHNTESVVEKISYDPNRDVENSPDSVFCSHGAGVNVKWNLVDDFCHVESGLSFDDGSVKLDSSKLRTSNIDFDNRQLEDILAKEFGPIKRPKYSTVIYEPKDGYKAPALEYKKEYLLIDGYNIIFAWKDLKELAGTSIDAARESLIDILCNFKAVRGCELILVFDGYKVKGNEGTKYEQAGINIVFTKEAQSADSYIESLVKDLGHDYRVCVVTSDGLIQLAALRQGTRRMSSLEFEKIIEEYKLKIKDIIAMNAAHKHKLEDFARISKK